MRLDKYLAQSGTGTRSEVKKIISDGRVRVDGNPVSDAGFKVPDGAIVLLDGNPVVYEEYEYFMLNKPSGVISAVKDKNPNEICVTELIRDPKRGDLFPVGRLDRDTEGLLLITNDGDLCHRLLSPKKHVDKKYFVRLSGTLTEGSTLILEDGVDIGDEKPTLPCSIERLSEHECYITIKEGRYHQIKRMFKTQGLEVIFLRRLSMGPLVLDESLEPGDYRKLNKKELLALREL